VVTLFVKAAEVEAVS